MFIVRFWDPDYHCRLYDGALIKDLRSFVHELLRYKLTFYIEYVGYNDILIRDELSEDE